MFCVEPIFDKNIGEISTMSYFTVDVYVSMVVFSFTEMISLDHITKNHLS